MAIARSFFSLVILLLAWTGCSSEEPTKKHPAYYVVDISGGAEAASYPATAHESLPEDAGSEIYKTGKIILKWRGPGSFTMGQSKIATPSRKVTLSGGFYIGIYEITQAQWANVMGAHEFNFADEASNPAESVSWEDIRGAQSGHDWPAEREVAAASFMGRLSAKAGKELLFDLPTEAQWEYACRAGTETEWGFGDDEDVDEYAWTNENSEKATNEVGTLKPNGWGLYDMHGNIAEWCLDRFGSYTAGAQTDPTGAATGWYRIWRGGGWDVSDYLVRSAHRAGDVPSSRFIHVGFRLAAQPK